MGAQVIVIETHRRVDFLDLDAQHHVTCCLVDSGLDGIHQRIDQQLLLVGTPARPEARPST